jgi:nitrate reductase delta subunit
MDLDTIAFLLEYPGIAFASKIEAARLESGGSEEMDRAFDALARHLESRGKAAAEEHYTQLFDLSPVCTLHIGYHLFGDAYGRGELLAGLVGELKKAGVPLGDEIPDFLPTLLRLVSRIEDDDDRHVFVEQVLLPGLDKMVDSLAESKDPWSAIVRALPELLRQLTPEKEVTAHA